MPDCSPDSWVEYLAQVEHLMRVRVPCQNLVALEGSRVASYLEIYQV